jgi:competence CoiA-like predicted nuclease
MSIWYREVLEFFVYLLPVKSYSTWNILVTHIRTYGRTDGHTQSGYPITALFAGERGNKTKTKLNFVLRSFAYFATLFENLHLVFKLQSMTVEWRSSFIFMSIIIRAILIT